MLPLQIPQEMLAPKQNFLYIGGDQQTIIFSIFGSLHVPALQAMGRKSFLPAAQRVPEHFVGEGKLKSAQSRDILRQKTTRKNHFPVGS